MKKSVSIVVPVYRVEQYLDRCVKSILAQTFLDFELILVDDGSPDRCPQMCDEWAEKDDRIVVIHKKNGGLPDARNYGIQAAKGEYLAFVDSDDWVEPDFLKYLFEGAKAGGYDMVQCNFERVFMNGSTLSYVYKPAVYDRKAIRDLMTDLANYRLKDLAGYRWNKLYKTEIMKKAVEITDIKIVMGEDNLLNMAYWGFSNTIRSLETPILYHYCENGQSICANYRSKDKYECAQYYESIVRIGEYFQCSGLLGADELTQSRRRYYIYECAICDWSRADRKKEIREIIRMLDKKSWYASIRTYDTLAKRICMWMSYFGLIDLMLVMVDIRKKMLHSQ